MEAVVFDLFHTLVDVARAPGARGRYTADILGIDRSAWNRACFSEHHDICRPSSQYEVIRSLARHIDPTIPDSRIRDAAEERQRRFDNALMHIEPKTLDVLNSLRKGGRRLALVSNASTGEVAAWPGSPLAPRFDKAVFSCDCGMKKPEPGIYHLALDALGVSPERSFFVGDGGSREHIGASAVGMRTVMVTRFIDEQTRLERREGVRHEIESIAELLDLL